jgi:hypothetical protein
MNALRAPLPPLLRLDGVSGLSAMRFSVEHGRRLAEILLEHGPVALNRPARTCPDLLCPDLLLTISTIEAKLNAKSNSD